MISRVHARILDLAQTSRAFFVILRNLRSYFKDSKLLVSIAYARRHVQSRESVGIKAERRSKRRVITSCSTSAAARTRLRSAQPFDIHNLQRTFDASILASSFHSPFLPAIPIDAISLGFSRRATTSATPIDAPNF